MHRFPLRSCVEQRAVATQGDVLASTSEGQGGLVSVKAGMIAGLHLSASEPTT